MPGSRLEEIYYELPVWLYSRDERLPDMRTTAGVPDGGALLECG